MVGGGQIVSNRLQRSRVHGNVPQFSALAVNAEVFDAPALMDVADQQLAELIASQRVVEEDRQDGSIPFGFEDLSLGCQQASRRIPPALGTHQPCVFR